MLEKENALRGLGFCTGRGDMHQSNDGHKALADTALFPYRASAMFIAPKMVGAVTVASVPSVKRTVNFILSSVENKNALRKQIP
jgi:hypothetical protein